MARLRSAIRPPAVAGPEVAAGEAWWDCRLLFIAHDPGPADAIRGAVHAERDRLAGCDLTAAERVAALLAFCDANGWGDAARHHLDHMAAIRARRIAERNRT